MGVERLTDKSWRNLDPWECCGQDKFCTRGCHDLGGCLYGCIVPKLYDRLAAYEDTELEPAEVRAQASLFEYITAECGPSEAVKSFERLRELAQADVEGRVVVLPCKVGDTVYVVGERRVVDCSIVEGYFNDKNDVGYFVSYSCDDECEGCPFNSWHQDFTGEYSCDGEFGEASISAEQFGKAVFLTREEAEKALGGGGDV